MKVIVAGSRDITDYSILRLTFSVIESGFNITEVVSGTARGIDTLGEEWANQGNIPVARFPADWKKHGKAAGPIRNKQMAEYADAAIVIHNGSRGSLNMIETMKKLNKPVYEVKV
jgi:predicted Rossmann fold nucleotide-binding protein DprA/Smf involved in DNA uptake